MTEKKTMYYCCYQNCYFYSVRSQQDLIDHYVEDHRETYEEAERLAKQNTLMFSKSLSKI